MRFGRLMVVAPTGRKQRGSYLWVCRCDCGVDGLEFSVSKLNRAGGVRSCGCLQREAVGNANRTHGMSRKGVCARTYRIWAGIIARCTNSEDRAFKHYGGRGITVCDRWRKFENFFEDMGMAPAGLSIDRVDNNKGYCLENCMWATTVQQQNNKRNTVMIEAFDLIMSAPEWSVLTGVPACTIKARIRAGLSPETALIKPVRGIGRLWQERVGFV